MRDRTTTGRGAVSPRSPRPTRQAVPASRGRGAMVAWVVVAIVVVGALFYAFQSARNSGHTAGTGYAVGSPGPGAQAPGFQLDSTRGPVDLASYRGKTVLLYFQEGIGCQPCWDQIRDLQAAASKIKAAGVDQILSITTSPLDLVKQQVLDDSLSIPVASDPSLSVSRAYNANQYGMMGTSRDGHSFVLVGPDGTIRWRADYGGAPKYTMYVPVEKLLADMAKGADKTTAGGKT